MFNKVILVGNLTRDIELRYAQNGTAIAKTGLATNRRRKNQNGENVDETMFIDVTFFGRSGEIANQYLRKGSKILVEGRLQFEQWVDQNNQKRSKHSVVAENMQMLDSRNDAPSGNSYDGGYNAPQQNYNNGAQGSSYQAPQQQQQYNNPPQQNQGYNAPQSAPKMPESNLPEIDIDEDEIPF